VSISNGVKKNMNMNMNNNDLCAKNFIKMTENIPKSEIGDKHVGFFKIGFNSRDEEVAKLTSDLEQVNKGWERVAFEWSEYVAAKEEELERLKIKLAFAIKENTKMHEELENVLKDRGGGCMSNATEAWCDPMMGLVTKQQSEIEKLREQLKEAVELLDTVMDESDLVSITYEKVETFLSKHKEN
jgi:predicted  nucleic acid-binding Zn-ribbon protein